VNGQTISPFSPVQGWTFLKRPAINAPRFPQLRSSGLHVHLITNQFIDVKRARELAAQAGWDRIHVTPMPSEHCGYLAKYLSKERPDCLYRWRLWAGFGRAWQWTKVKDVIRETLFSRIYRACKEWKGWTGPDGFSERMQARRRMMLLTIEHGWQAGFGPSGKAYAMCSEDELTLDSPASEAWL